MDLCSNSASIFNIQNENYNNFGVSELKYYKYESESEYESKCMVILRVTVGIVCSLKDSFDFEERICFLTATTYGFFHSFYSCIYFFSFLFVAVGVYVCFPFLIVPFNPFHSFVLCATLFHIVIINILSPFLSHSLFIDLDLHSNLN